MDRKDQDQHQDSDYIWNRVEDNRIRKEYKGGFNSICNIFLYNSKLSIV